jgi:hypothetical protein
MLESAIAYLRPDLSDEPSEADVVLGGNDEPVLKRLGNGMLVAYLVDQGDHFTWVQRRHLVAEDVVSAQLHGQALMNLGAKASEMLRVTDQGEFFACFLDGNFEASLLLLDDLWDKHLRELTPNGVVVGVPARDILMFCDAKSELGMQEIAGRVDRVWPNGDHLLRRELYMRGDQAWHRHSAQQSVQPDRREDAAPG